MTGTADTAIRTSPGRSPWRLPGLLLLAVAITIAGAALADRWRGAGPADSLDPASPRAWFGPATYREALATVDRDVAAARTNDAAVPNQWLRQEVLARALMARWRLAGDYADLVEAQRLLDRGLDLAPYPAGPVFSRILLATTVHDIPTAERLLARVGEFSATADDEAADARTFAGDIALQRGQLDDAARLYGEAERIAASPGGNLRDSNLRFVRGQRAEAIRMVETMLASPRQQPQALATLMLQRANFAYAEGDWAGAGRWIGAAQRMFRGWWLADAYAAQQFALAGRTAEATEAYRRVIHKSERPEVMDALAHLMRLQGDAVSSRELAGQARRAWARRAAPFPEAVAHHQAEHELAVGSAAAALAFAQTDVASRPQAPNQVLLARALLSAGRPQKALAALDRADAQGWVSAAQHMARAEVAAALGDTAMAEAARTKALALNPRAADPRSRLIWFGHD